MITITINYKDNNYIFEDAVKSALISLTGINIDKVDAVVYPPKNKVPLCCDWIISPKGVPDAVVYVDGQLLTLSIV